MLSIGWPPARMRVYYQQPQNSTLSGLACFAVNGLGPLLLQLLQTTLGPTAKTIQHLKPLLGFEKPGVLLIELGLVKLLNAV